MCGRCGVLVGTEHVERTVNKINHKFGNFLLLCIYYGPD